MLVQDTLTGYLHEVPDSQLYEAGPIVYDGLGNPLGFFNIIRGIASLFKSRPRPQPGPHPSWQPYMHRQWYQEPHLPSYWLSQPFESALSARRNAYFRWSQERGMTQGMPGGGFFPEMFPTPGFPGMLPMPGMPGFPGMPGMLPGMATGSRRRRRKRRR